MHPSRRPRTWNPYDVGLCWVLSCATGCMQMLVLRRAVGTQNFCNLNKIAHPRRYLWLPKGLICCQSRGADKNGNPVSFQQTDVSRPAYHQNGSPASENPSRRDPSHAEIEFRDVHLSIDGKNIINGLNLRVSRGESLAIIGTSGTGKSTALRLIAGLLFPTKGELFLRGRKRLRPITDFLWDQDEEPQVRISMVFQNGALFDSMTVGENVGFPLLHKTNLSPERIRELVNIWLDRVGLSKNIYDVLPEKLSGGMRKRVSFARAVIFDPDDLSTAPDLLLIDEVTAGLDPVVSTRIEDLIRQMQAYCPTCVIVTHQFSTIRRTADRVVFLHEGLAVWDGSVAQLDATENPYVRQFMTADAHGPLAHHQDNAPLQ